MGKIGIMIEEKVSGNSKNKIGQDIEGNYVNINNDENIYFIVQTRPEIV